MIDLLSKINIINENDYKTAIKSSLKKSQKKIFFYLNSQISYESNNSSKVKNSVLSADYLIADGYSIVWANKRLFNKEIEKVVFTYSYFKFIRSLFILYNSKIFFLGAKTEILQKAIKKEKLAYPNLKIVGHHNGYFDKQDETISIIKLINDSNADVLIVGMGCPIAENWIIENKENINATLIFSVGGFYDFLSEEKINAPNWMYNSGLEWIYRLIQEPKRLFKRYFLANLFFILTILKMKFKNGN